MSNMHDNGPDAPVTELGAALLQGDRLRRRVRELEAENERLNIVTQRLVRERDEALEALRRKESKP